ncbi:YjzD family protein [Sporosarcina sp. G11-34]|uniref:YjzD family protein n=1 Tax=Sporosarcina sp. G11-34 TaxID=2849605 RepID=UPI0022A96985|nr:YjzD family protein [Sporosarcina sp. G11-34]MCZ2258995.1 YjzD family protein [Sporosarcina sp. G11-34]
MRFIITFIWSFCLVSLVNYVVGAIANVPFDLQAGAIISVILSVLVIILGEALPEGPISDH